jgi:hypothetical protein
VIFNALPLNLSCSTVGDLSVLAAWPYISNFLA